MAHPPYERTPEQQRLIDAEMKGFSEGCEFEQASFHRTLDRVGVSPRVDNETACRRVRRHFKGA